MVAAITDMQQEVESFDDEERPIYLHWPPPCLLDESSSSSGQGGLDLNVKIIVEESKSVINKSKNDPKKVQMTNNNCLDNNKNSEG